MSKRFRVYNKLLNTDKTWLDINQTQRDWILRVLKEEYLTFVLQNSKKPSPMESERILERVYNKIIEKEIWISIEEVRKQWNKVRDIANKAVPNK